MTKTQRKKLKDIQTALIQKQELLARRLTCRMVFNVPPDQDLVRCFECMWMCSDLVEEVLKAAKS